MLIEAGAARQQNFPTHRARERFLLAIGHLGRTGGAVFSVGGNIGFHPVVDFQKTRSVANLARISPLLVIGT